MNNPLREQQPLSDLEHDSGNEIIFFISHSDILLCNFSNINEQIEQLSENKTLLLKSARQVYFAVDGYNDDLRELCEIPEVRRWFLESMLTAHIPWFYWLKEGEQLRIILTTFCDVQITERRLLQLNPIEGMVLAQFNNRSQVQTWFEINRDNLVKWVRKKKLPLEIGLTILNQVKEMSQMFHLSSTFPLSQTSQYREDLGEYLYKYPQLKKCLLNKTFSLIIGSFRLAKQSEGIEVTALMFFPLVSRTDKDIYYVTLRFSPEIDVDLLTHVLKTSWLSFQVTGFGKYGKNRMGERYRPLEVTWFAPEKMFYEVEPL